MEKVSKTKYNTSQFTLYCSLDSISCSMGGQGVRQQTPHHWLSMPYLLAPSAGPTSSCVILVTVSVDCFSLLAIADFIHAYAVNLLKK